MPAPSGFIRTNGSLANQMAINAAIGSFTTQALDNIRYTTYATGQNQMGFTPLDREDY